jgi:hypothetical protein
LVSSLYGLYIQPREKKIKEREREKRAGENV